jgi:hypothetical protein
LLPLRATPVQMALAFAVLASGLVAAASLLEGTLLDEKTLRVGAQVYVQHPYVANLSTILDFALFNPIAIYFLWDARQGFKRAYAHFEKDGGLPQVHQAALPFVSAVVGLSTMWFYYDGFVGGHVFTEAFVPDSAGRAVISLTGYLIFVATALFLALLFYAIIQFGAYAVFVRSLGPKDFKFCLPPQVSREIEIAVRPCISATYVLTAIFGILVIFVIRDYWQLGLHRSTRIWLLAPYLLTCLVAFLPFWHLHRIMAEQKSQLIEVNNCVLERDVLPSSDLETHRAAERFFSIDPHRLIASVDRIQRLQLFYASIRVWPTRPGALFLPNMSVLVSGVTLTLKLVESFRPH